jgi:hypothetical protein
MSKHLIWFAFLAIIFLGGCMDTSIPEGNPTTVNIPAGITEDVVIENIVENVTEDITEDIAEEPVIEDEKELMEVEEIMDYDYEIENLEVEVDGLLDEFNISLEGLE